MIVVIKERRREKELGEVAYFRIVSFFCSHPPLAAAAQTTSPAFLPGSILSIAPCHPADVVRLVVAAGKRRRGVLTKTLAAVSPPPMRVRTKILSAAVSTEPAGGGRRRAAGKAAKQQQVVSSSQLCGSRSYASILSRTLACFSTNDAFPLRGQASTFGGKAPRPRPRADSGRIFPA